MIWGLVNVMQLIVYLPLMNVNFPQNAATLYSALAQISSFNLLPSDKIYDFIFRDNFTDDEMTDINFT